MMGGVVAMSKTGRGKTEYQAVMLHPVEKRFIEYLRQLGFASLEIKVQDGLPVMAEKVTEKVKFTNS